MTKEEAKRLIRETFEKPFAESQFNNFIKNLLNEIDESKAFAYHGTYIRDAYRPHITQYKRIGQYTDPEGQILDVLIVKLKRETSLERARTMQRNFIGQYFKDRGDDKDNAIVAFYHEDLDDWRFSFVKRDYRLDETESGKVKAREGLSPARRYSFLVGENEPSHTAQQQLVPILQDDVYNPTLSQIESAFNIETVTKEFYEKYRQLYLKLKEELDQLVKKDEEIKEEFAAKNISTENFAKKLLGQIVFLYFLQKKGWMGIEKDERGIYKLWGTGPKNFLKKLFSKHYVDYGNFFDEVLEPLFYQALRIDRGKVSEFSQFNCKIPFLNGGLFEPIGEYSWEETRIFINNETIGEILDTFDLYNFTVKEDEPLDKEVAVDPEMLGKVFENLLEVKDRKSKGTYYTPREIVHYMCQESLINYLDATLNTQKVELVESKPTQPKLLGKPDPQQSSLRTDIYKPIVPKEDIENFIRKGETVIEHDFRVENEGRETRDYSYRIDKSIRNNARLMDEALASIKICDPAIGSGAFPVGMMQEIVKAREILTTYIGDNTGRNAYDFKRHCIQESLYGVDIDPSAVDIAKLRLWLSLVVDEEDYGTIKPLPNLDYRIICGNSLLGLERDFSENNLFLRKLESLKSIFFDETNLRKKKLLNLEIEKIISQIIKENEVFDFRILFSEVFHSKGGFDIVIANPPYIRVQNLTSTEKKYMKENYKSATKNFDIYVIFDEKGLEITRGKGVLCYIQPNKFFNSDYGIGLRLFLSSNNYVLKIIDFGANQIFSAVTTYTCILICKKASNKEYEYVGFPNNGETAFYQYASGSESLPSLVHEIFRSSTLTEKHWSFGSTKEIELFNKIEKHGIPLGDYSNKIFVGLQTSADTVYILEKRNGKYYSPYLERFIEIEEDILKPILKGEEIQRYLLRENKYWLIFPYYKYNNRAVIIPEDTLAMKYPRTWAYLLLCQEQLKRRDNGRMGNDNWYAYVYPKNLLEFEQIKIMAQVLAKKASMVIDTDAKYYFVGGGNAGGYGITVKDDVNINLAYLLALLNSSLLDFYLQHHSSKFQNGYFSYAKRFIEKIPIKNIPSDEQKLFIDIVEKILLVTRNSDYLKNNQKHAQVREYERQIDQMVYNLYGLTDDEIAIVESKA